MKDFEENAVPSRTGVVGNVNTHVTYEDSPVPQDTLQSLSVQDGRSESQRNTDMTKEKEDIPLIRVDEEDTNQVVLGSLMATIGIVLGAHATYHGKPIRTTGALVLFGAGLYTIFSA